MKIESVNSINREYKIAPIIRRAIESIDHDLNMSDNFIREIELTQEREDLFTILTFIDDNTKIRIRME